MSEHRTICTIIAKNYLAFARTLAQSFLSQYPAGKVYVLVVDDFAGFINPADECFEIVKLADLKIPNLPEFCFKYNLKELCTAAKAGFLEYLIREKSIARLVYLDPDILITGSLNDIYEKLGTHDIVLTPHLDTDYPDDDLLPDDGHILRAGQFNLGFIGVNSTENARAFLNWWKSKLYEKCVVDVANGYFVDQRFIDFVPLFFKQVWIEKDTGYNVAYWNLHSRQLSEVSGVWNCNDGRLYFFHFSGYDPEGPAISSHVPESLARYRFANRGDLRKLFKDYKDRLLENGHGETSRWPYSFGNFKTGERVPDDVRSYYRNLPEAQRHKNPFDSHELKQLARQDSQFAEGSAPTPAAQLDAILNSRAWSWVSRYGRFKNRYLTPASRSLSRLLGTGSRSNASMKGGNRESRGPSVGSVCFCTLAIHEPYRRRAQQLCADARTVPWIVLTDEPDDFASLPVRAIRHAPTGPMAADYLTLLPATGEGRGAAAYHDKRFALSAALEDFDTAIYVDADSRLVALPALGVFPPGLAVLPVVRKSVAQHLETVGSWRLPFFEELARELSGDTEILRAARWCHETLVAVTKDGRESRFFEAWSRGADLLQSRGVYSGEGGVIGLAAAYAGWAVDYAALTELDAAMDHEGGGPKEL
jgi:hypothetical protein